MRGSQFADELLKASGKTVEKDLRDKLRRAAAGKGSLQIQFEKGANGLPKKVNLSGDQAAIDAALAALK